MVNFQIHGGRKLSGAIVTNTSKNSAVVLLCASLLNRNRTLLKNMPRIEEVNRLIEVLRSIGVQVNWIKENNLEIIPPALSDFSLGNLDSEAGVKTRSILMLIAPLAHLFRNFKLPHQGGCRLGKRTIRPHVFALEKLGIKISTFRTFHKIAADKFHPAEIVLYESGDTATANVIMAAAKIPGATKIKLASANYQVQDLCRYLVAAGIKIEGIGATTLTVYGKKDINIPMEFCPSEDPIESMLFLSIAATTGSNVVIKRCPIDFLELELLKLEKMGFRFKISKKYKSRNGFTDLVDIKTFPSRLVALEEKIYARPFPGLNIDNLPFFVPIATQAKGTTLIHDWIYEERALYYTELKKLGADIFLADPHRVYINGPVKLKATEIICPPALRPAAVILIAMLVAKGTSILRNVYSINRGYEDLCTRLNSLGAKIQVI